MIKMCEVCDVAPFDTRPPSPRGTLLAGNVVVVMRWDAWARIQIRATQLRPTPRPAPGLCDIHWSSPCECVVWYMSMIHRTSSQLHRPNHLATSYHCHSLKCFVIDTEIDPDGEASPASVARRGWANWSSRIRTELCCFVI